jgi:hypothetical protein
MPPRHWTWPIAEPPERLSLARGSLSAQDGRSSSNRVTGRGTLQSGSQFRTQLLGFPRIHIVYAAIAQSLPVALWPTRGLCSPAPFVLAPVRLARGSTRANRAGVWASIRSSFFRLSPIKRRLQASPRSPQAPTRSVPGLPRASASRFPARSGSAGSRRTLPSSLSGSCPVSAPGQSPLLHPAHITNSSDRTGPIRSSASVEKNSYSALRLRC